MPKNRAAYQKTYYQKHKKRYVAQKRARRAIPSVRKHYLEVDRRSAHVRKYGITLEEKAEIFRQQGRRCAICRSAIPRHKHNWVLDHDHKTGKIRGVLCSPCNLGLGLFKHDIQLLLNAGDYIRNTT